MSATRKAHVAIFRRLAAEFENLAARPTTSQLLMRGIQQGDVKAALRGERGPWPKESLSQLRSGAGRAILGAHEQGLLEHRGVSGAIATYLRLPKVEEKKPDSLFDQIAGEVFAAIVPAALDMHAEERYAACCEWLACVIEEATMGAAADNALPDEASKSATGRRRRRRQPAKPIDSLTSRQAEAVHIVGEANGNFSEAAKAMGISRAAVVKLYRKAMHRLGRNALTKPRTKAIPTDQRGQDNVAVKSSFEHAEAILDIREELKRTGLTETQALKIVKATAKTLDEITLEQAYALQEDLAKRTG
jgi:predicted DNA-binding protein (UPF0251 family)